MDELYEFQHVVKTYGEGERKLVIFVNDTSAYLGADQCQRLNLLEKYIQTIFRSVYSLMTAVGFDLPCIFQKLTDAQEFPASKRCTDFQTL